MSFIVLHADRLATALADDPVVPAAQLGVLNSALTLMAEANDLHADIGRQADAARREGHEAGYADGHSEGLEAGAIDVRAELFRLAMRDGEERRKRQSEIAALALEVVRRIAGDVGDAAFVAGLAERATAAVAPDTAATVRVAPDQLAAVRARLAARPAIAVEADASLAASDCVVDTAFGSAHAGLETQLAQIEAAWTGAAG